MLIANTPPFSTINNRFEPLARVTLYLTDEMTTHDMLGAAWLTIAFADSCLEIKILPKKEKENIKHRKGTRGNSSLEQGVTRASDSGPLQKKAQKKHNPPVVTLVLYYSTVVLQYDVSCSDVSVIFIVISLQPIKLVVYYVASTW